MLLRDIGCAMAGVSNGVRVYMTLDDVLDASEGDSTCFAANCLHNVRCRCMNDHLFPAGVGASSTADNEMSMVSMVLKPEMSGFTISERKPYVQMLKVREGVSANMFRQEFLGEFVDE